MARYTERSSRFSYGRPPVKLEKGIDALARVLPRKGSYPNNTAAKNVLMGLSNEYKSRGYADDAVRWMLNVGILVQGKRRGKKRLFFDDVRAREVLDHIENGAELSQLPDDEDDQVHKIMRRQQKRNARARKKSGETAPAPTPPTPTASATETEAPTEPTPTASKPKPEPKVKKCKETPVTVRKHKRVMWMLPHEHELWEALLMMYAEINDTIGEARLGIQNDPEGFVKQLDLDESLVEDSHDYVEVFCRLALGGILERVNGGVNSETGKSTYRFLIHPDEILVEPISERLETDTSANWLRLVADIEAGRFTTGLSHVGVSQSYADLARLWMRQYWQGEKPPSLAGLRTKLHNYATSARNDGPAFGWGITHKVGDRYLVCIASFERRRLLLKGEQVASAPCKPKKLCESAPAPEVVETEAQPPEVVETAPPPEPEISEAPAPADPEPEVVPEPEPKKAIKDMNLEELLAEEHQLAEELRQMQEERQKLVERMLEAQALERAVRIRREELEERQRKRREAAEKVAELQRQLAEAQATLESLS